MNVVQIELPPLRDRKEDIEQLCAFYIRSFNARFRSHFERVAPSAARLLHEHDWPGNVRELRNVIEVAFVMAADRRASLLDLPAHVAARLARRDGVAVSDRDRVLRALEDATWNKKVAAQHLGCSRMTLYRKMSKYRIASQRRPS